MISSMIFLLQRAAFVLALRKAFFAVYRPIVSWLERNFAFFLALRANCLEHLPPPSKTTALTSHFFLLLILQMFRARRRRPWLRRKLHRFSLQFPLFLFPGLLFPGHLLLVFFGGMLLSIAFFHLVLPAMVSFAIIFRADYSSSMPSESILAILLF